DRAGAAGRDADRDRSRPGAPSRGHRLAGKLLTGGAAHGARVQDVGGGIGGEGDRDRDAGLRGRSVRSSRGSRSPVPRRTRRDRDGANHRPHPRVHWPGAVRDGALLMEKPIIVGAVLYDPKVSVIWEIIRDFFDEHGFPMDVVFYTNYELQVQGLVDGHLDIAWNSPLAWLDAQRISGGRCHAIAMRDTD